MIRMEKSSPPKMSAQTQSFKCPLYAAGNLFYTHSGARKNAGATRIINIFNSRPLIGFEKHSFDSPLLADETYIETAANIKGEVFSDNLDKIISKNPFGNCFCGSWQIHG